MKTVVFFNNKGGVGKTSLVHHLACMFARGNVSTIAVDLDPQANLSSIFLHDARLEELWTAGDDRKTVFQAIKPLLDGYGDARPPHVEKIEEHLGLVVGDVLLSRNEDELGGPWFDALDRRPRAFRVLSAFSRVIQYAGDSASADLALIDVGPNLGAINRAALIAANYVVVPLAPDLFSLQGLENLGPILRGWREGWRERLERFRDDRTGDSLQLPRGEMEPIGYVVMQYGERLDRPVRAYEKWLRRIPSVYSRELLNEQSELEDRLAAEDPHCLATLKHFRSLMPMAMEAKKPMFDLRSADGVFGAHANAVNQCFRAFSVLAREIAARIDLPFDDI